MRDQIHSVDRGAAFLDGQFAKKGVSILDAVQRAATDLPTLQNTEAIQDAPEAATGTEAISNDNHAVVERLAKLSPIEYDHTRKTEAKALGIRNTTLDKLVREQRKGKNQTDGMEFDDVEAWACPVDLSQLLSELTDTIKRFIVCNESTTHSAALWVVMTWFMEVVQIAPLAVITAPEKRCGKSVLLSILGKLVYRPLMASNITPAALFRSVDAWKPTLLVDEADAFMRDNEELRGLINCGHTRDSAYIVRVVGDEHVPKRFCVWGAKALAGIGHLADTIMDRAIVLELRRKLPHEVVARLRHAESGLFDDLSSKLARIAVDYGDAMRRARPDLPSKLNDRAQDNWEPLLAIADLAGGEWPERARKAALALSGSADDHGAVGTELLADIREVFETKDTNKISTSDLIRALCADDEKPWATYNRGNPIKPRQVAKKLKEYGVTSKNLRIAQSVTKGFECTQFSDAFSRYLATPSKMPLQRYKDEFPFEVNALTVADEKSCSGNETASATHISQLNQGCSGVADRMPPNLSAKIVEVEV